MRRVDIEMLQGSKVYLECHGSVQEDWRNKVNFIRQIGYVEESRLILKAEDNINAPKGLSSKQLIMVNLDKIITILNEHGAKYHLLSKS